MIKKENTEKRWINIVTIFLFITVIWNMAEGSVSVYFGYLGGDLSLFAFGIDSWIEVLSASLVLYHMIFKSLPKLKKKINVRTLTTSLNNSSERKSTLFSLETERKLTLFIGILLIVFCLFACVGGIFRLIEQNHPSSTTIGIIVGGVCIIAMAILWYYKTKASVILNSSTLASDAACSLGCIRLSFVLLIGSIVYEIWPKLWWVDAVTAILIGLLVGYEGYQTIKGAMDKQKFSGGCGCCGATDSGLAKYFRVKIEKQLNMDKKNNNNDDCCADGDGDCCNNKNENDDDDDSSDDDDIYGDCCSGGDCDKNNTDKTSKSSKLYVAINDNTNNNTTKCDGGDCCSGTK